MRRSKKKAKVFRDMLCSEYKTEVEGRQRELYKEEEQNLCSFHEMLRASNSKEAGDLLHSVQSRNLQNFSGNL
jgi:hypothetical protein